MYLNLFSSEYLRRECINFLFHQNTKNKKLLAGVEPAIMRYKHTVMPFHHRSINLRVKCLNRNYASSIANGIRIIDATIKSKLMTMSDIANIHIGSLTIKQYLLIDRIIAPMIVYTST